MADAPLLARDIDLADDLFQDTYLRAREGIGTYSGGDSRPWLVAIARNVYYSYARRRQTWAEVAFDRPEPREELPSVDLLGLVAIRQTLADLPAIFRTALVMKHYAGYTYQEIARHQHCPVGTAKWRVSEALGRLRLALLGERTEMAGGAKVHGIAIVDYAYGVLPEDEAARVRAHLAECDCCRREAEELKQVTALIDALEGDHKQMHFVELDREGAHTLYVTGSHANTGDHPFETLTFVSGKGVRVQRCYQDGEEATFTVGPCPESDDLETYTVTLAHPVPPGQRLNELSIYPSGVRSRMQKLMDGRFRFHWTQSPGSHEFAYVQVIRLPVGARLLSAEPQPDETGCDGTTTLVWRRVLPGGQSFECTVEYRLGASGSGVLHYRARTRCQGEGGMPRCIPAGSSCCP